MGYHRKFIEGMEHLVNTYLGACLSLSKGSKIPAIIFFRTYTFVILFATALKGRPDSVSYLIQSCRTLMLSTEIVITYLRTATSMVTKIPDNEQTFFEKERQFVRRDSFSA